jgi:hypothetical protein
VTEATLLSLCASSDAESLLDDNHALLEAVEPSITALELDM